MDKIFMEFEEWYLNKRTKWQQAGIIKFNSMSDLDTYEKEFMDHILY